MKLFNLVTLGRFLEGNSLEVALKAYADFYHGVSRKYQKKTHLTLIDKRYHQVLNKEMTDELNLQECITFLNLQEQELIIETYKASSLLILPRILNSSSIIKESFLYGLPILCYENPSHSNLLDSSNSMTVIYQNDTQVTQQFSNNLNLLNYDPDAVRFLKKGAAIKYERDLSWGRRVQTG
jgi:glycosyltransferase involved in cell wall biosynthesis